MRTGSQTYDIINLLKKCRGQVEEMEDLQIQKIGNVLQTMDRMCQNPNFYKRPILRMSTVFIRDGLCSIEEDIKEEYPDQSEDISMLKDVVFDKNAYIDPFTFGRIYQILKSILDDYFAKRDH